MHFFGNYFRLNPIKTPWAHCRHTHTHSFSSISCEHIFNYTHRLNRGVPATLICIFSSFFKSQFCPWIIDTRLKYSFVRWKGISFLFHFFAWIFNANFFFHSAIRYEFMFFFRILKYIIKLSFPGAGISTRIIEMLKCRTNNRNATNLNGN